MKQIPLHAQRERDAGSETSLSDTTISLVKRSNHEIAAFHARRGISVEGNCARGLNKADKLKKPVVQTTS